MKTKMRAITQKHENACSYSKRVYVTAVAWPSPLGRLVPLHMHTLTHTRARARARTLSRALRDTRTQNALCALRATQRAWVSKRSEALTHCSRKCVQLLRMRERDSRCSARGFRARRAGEGPFAVW